MKLSIIIPVLNSPEVVRRQILYLAGLGLPGDVELLLVDDGSEPQLEIHNAGKSWLKITRTRDYRPWTWALARNKGARLARGEYLLMTDIDHILSADAIETARTFGGQKIQFQRQFGVLSENGELVQDLDTLKTYGLQDKWINPALSVPPLPNNFVMRADVFWALGGYREDLVGRPYPQGEDHAFKGAWKRWIGEGKGQVHTYRPTLYVFPTGQFCGDVDYNPFGLFHGLSRKSARNAKYRRQLAEETL